MTYQRIAIAAGLAVAVGMAGCAAMQGADKSGEEAVALMKKDFKSRGQATIERLNQDEVQATCTKYSGDAALPPEEAQRIEAAQRSLIRYPADGQYLGDWKAGEKVAQNGTGKQWSDNPSKPGGGNCYACHELTKEELSFGTIGPSLYHFGRNRGYTPQMRKYVYGKVYNSEAFAACSSMPRYGQHEILTEQQIKDVVALLMDPNSPVNQ